MTTTAEFSHKHYKDKSYLLIFLCSVYYFDLYRDLKLP